MPSRPKSPGPLSGTKPASPADANTTPSTPTDILPPEALRSLEEIGVDVSNATKLLHAVRTISATSYRGPIPPAEMLAEYERIQPGLARQIIGWTEAQQAHRQSMDRIAIES